MALPPLSLSLADTGHAISSATGSASGGERIVNFNTSPPKANNAIFIAVAIVLAALLLRG